MWIPLWTLADSFLFCFLTILSRKHCRKRPKITFFPGCWRQQLCLLSASGSDLGGTDEWPGQCLHTNSIIYGVAVYNSSVCSEKKCPRPSRRAPGTMTEWNDICSTGKRLREVFHTNINCAQELFKKRLYNQNNEIGLIA